MQQKKYGLFTAITMVVGIVVGSGIFFKSDNILRYTNGNIFLGVLVFIIAAVGIIFGSLTISELSSKTNNAGGLIAYAEEFIGKRVACSIGWFQTFIYYPVLTAVVSWVVGIYTCILFNLESTLELQILIGSAYMVFSYLINTLSAKLGGYFQNIATIIKIIPLIFIAVGGLMFGDVSHFLLTNNLGQVATSVGWIAALGPIAFSFDGWIIATSISHEVKNSKRNLPVAYTVAPLFILIAYILYFVGISIYVGPEKIIELGDAHVNVVANNLLGPFGAKIVLIFVVISVMGTVNGIVLGSIRMPYSLSLRGMFLKSVEQINTKFDVPIKSSLVAFGLCIFWMICHYITQKYNFFNNSDISEGFVVISYAIYIVLYIKVILMHKKGEIKGVFRGVINPILAIWGSLIILYSGFQNSTFYFYIVVSAVVMGLSIWFIRSKKVDN
ncbi:MAG: APC family permease [Oscillospiraceae bacterium]